MIVVAGSDAAVGDGDAMRVSPEIGEDLRRAAERLLGIDDPIDAPRGGQMSGEGSGMGQGTVLNFVCGLGTMGRKERSHGPTQGTQDPGCYS